MAATSSAFVGGLGSSSTFLTGGKRSHELLSAGFGGRAIPAFTPGKLVVAAAAVQPKKSWIPAVRGGGNFIDPEWLDGS